MKIVIDIPKEYYETLKEMSDENLSMDMAIIKHGTPLPKYLSKIRAEIESQREEASNKDSEDKGLLNYYFGLNDGLKDARDIIDKYIERSDSE